MNILNISLDKNLLKKDSFVTRRLNLYMKKIDARIVVILHTLSKEKRVVHDRVTVIPTNSSDNISYIFDTLRIAKAFRKSDLLVTQDPHTTGFLGMLLKWRYNIPLCVHFHSDFSPYWRRENFQNRLFSIIEWFVIRASDGFRVVSAKIERELRKKGVRKPIMNVSTPINLDFFYKKNGKKVAEFKKKFPGKNLLFVGRLTKQKNLFFLLNAFKRLQEGRLLLAGKGELERELKLHVKRNNIKNVVFLGNLEKEDLKAAYYGCDVVVLPSLYEGTAKVLKEASACGKVSVASAVSGSDEVLAHKKNGFIFPINNMKLFLSHLKYVLANSKIAERMGKEAQKNIKIEKESSNVEKVTSIWKQTAKSF